GFMDEINRHEGLEVVAMKTANYLRTDAIRVTDKLLRQGITFDAIFAQSDSMAVGALLVLKKAGIDPESIVIVGIDYISDSRQAIRKGEQAGSFRYPTCGKEGAIYAMKILRGEQVPKSLIVPSILITRENVEAIEPVF
ncbi:MAG: substrate-binding domain-containing protein, partial [Desulfobulbaceae bacterium]|nr:substrate-binding domain-containing protein [Desulfobulbaceae bacterium]